MSSLQNLYAILLVMTANVSLSPVATADAVQETLDQFLSSHLNNTPVPGFSVVVVRDDQVVFQKGYGVEVQGTNKPMTVDSSVAIGSLTKSFTAVAVMQLVEQGKVSLDESIQVSY